MRTFLFSCSLALACICISAFTPDNKISALNKELKKYHFTYCPSGGITVDGKFLTIQGFYMSSTEITNAEYRTFLNDLKNSGRMDEYTIAQVDTAQWANALSYAEPLEHYYFTHPAYDDYPVVNISQQAAQLYCKWLTEQFRKAGLSYNVRLPEEAEWDYAAKSGKDERIYAWDGKFTRDKKGIYLANYKNISDSTFQALITAPAKSYRANDFGLYNMCGNVAEWISTTGETKGGDWNDGEAAMLIDHTDKRATAGASAMVGFRPVFTYWPVAGK